MNILVTAGSSQEPIDNVRSICNFSTGKTGAFISDYLFSQKHNVTLITSVSAIKPQNTNIKILEYKTFNDLHNILKNECNKQIYQVIIHAAAVSDYSPEFIEINNQKYKPFELSKIPSEENIIIYLKKNPKLLNFIKQWSSCNVKLFAFKLTSNANNKERLNAVNKLFNSTKDEYLPDYVISNDLSEINNNIHPFVLYSKDKKIVESNTLNDLAKEINNLIQN